MQEIIVYQYPKFSGQSEDCNLKWTQVSRHATARAEDLRQTYFLQMIENAVKLEVTTGPITHIKLRRVGRFTSRSQVPGTGNRVVNSQGVCLRVWRKSEGRVMACARLVSTMPAVFRLHSKLKLK